jgi:hypothetical protein
MATFSNIAIAFAAGYAVSVFTWGWLRTVLRGIPAEAEALRQRARDLEAKLRGLP